MSTLLAILVANTLVAAVLASIAWAAFRYGRPPALAHFFWVLALVKLTTPPLAPIPVGWTLRPERFFVEAGSRSGAVKDASGSALETPLAMNLTKEDDTVSSSPIKSPGDAIRRAPRRAGRAVQFPCTWEAFATVLGGVWVSGSVILAILLAWRARTFQRSLDRCISPDGMLSRRAWLLARRAGLKRAPRVLGADALLSPMLWGVGRRVQLIFPAGLKGRLSEEEVDSLLLHELGHYARGDHWVRVLELVCRVALWWHPLVWIALRQIGQVEEHCCDAWVVSRQSGSQRIYAEALLATIDFLNEEHVLAPPVASGLGDARLLRQRLTQIMAGTTSPAPSDASRCFAWAVGGALLLVHPAFGTVSLPSFNLPRFAERAPLASSAAPDSASEVIEPPAPLPVVPHQAPEIRQVANLEPLRLPAALWATATSPNGACRIEARAGRRTTLVHAGTGRRFDLDSYRITCVAFWPGQRQFFTGDEGGLIREWDSETGSPGRLWKGHDKEITSLHVSPDGKRLASGSLDGLVKIWQTEDLETLASKQWREDVISCVRWSPQGRELAVSVGGWSESVHPELIVWTPKSEEGDEKTQHIELEQPAGAITWLLDDDRILAAAWDGRTALWNTAATAQLAMTRVPKEEVSAAAWCAECPLQWRFVQEELR